MTRIDHGAIAQQLGYSKDEMIAKFGNPGAKSPTEIGNSLGLNNSTVTNIFGTQTNSVSASDFSDVSVGSLVSASKNDDDIASALGYTKEEMEAMFGKPGETDPKDIASKLGLSDEETTNIFGNYTLEEEEVENEEETEETESTGNTSADDKYQDVANALGYDAKTVSAIMKYVENGNVNDNPEKVIPAISRELQIPEEVVANVLNYIS